VPPGTGFHVIERAVFLKARKRHSPVTGLDDYELYSVVRRRRSRDVSDFGILRFTVQRRLWRLLPRLLRPAWARPLMPRGVTCGGCGPVR
jgi:hypothetical protein